MPASPEPDSPDDESRDDESRDPVWSLLGHAPRPSAPVDFSARVMAAARPVPAARHRPLCGWMTIVTAHIRRALLRPAFAAAAALALVLGAAWWWRIDPLAVATVPSNPGAGDPAIVFPTVSIALASTADDAEAVVQAFAAELALLDHADFLLAPQDGLDLEEEDLGHLF